jgi:hypothetical protein
MSQRVDKIMENSMDSINAQIRRHLFTFNYLKHFTDSSLEFETAESTAFVENALFWCT